MADKSLERLAVDLPKLLMQYRLAMAEMGSQEAHEMAMLKAQMDYKTSIKTEQENMADILNVIESERSKVEHRRLIKEKNIVDLQGQIQKTKLQIKGLAQNMPNIPDSDKTVDGYELPAIIEGYANDARKHVLDNEIEEYNIIQNQDAQLTETRNKYDEVFTTLTSLQTIGERHVGTDEGPGQKNLKQADDYEAYFNNVLTKQYDESGIAIPDSELPGNSERFEPGDEYTEYYKRVFVDTFSPTSAEVNKQKQIIMQTEQTQLANYTREHGVANQMLANATRSVMTSIYKYSKTPGAKNLQINEGFDRNSAAYVAAKEYLLEKSPDLNEEAIDTYIQKAINMGSVTEGKTFIKNMDKDKSGVVEGLYRAMGAGDSIDELRNKVTFANSFISQTGTPSLRRGYYDPSDRGGAPNAAQKAYEDIFGE